MQIRHLMSFVASIAFLVAPLQAGETWRVVGRCAKAGTPSAPGQGAFAVRVKVSGMDLKALEITSCSSKRPFHRVWPWGGDAVPIKLYAFPFFKKDSYDFLIETGWDDSVSYTLMSANASYEVVLQFTSVDGVYFNDHDNDGRWEIQVLDVESFKCANGADWGKDMIDSHRAQLSADLICKATQSGAP